MRLNFHQIDEKQGCLSIRSERHLTKGGKIELALEKIRRNVRKLELFAGAERSYSGKILIPPINEPKEWHYLNPKLKTNPEADTQGSKWIR